MAKGYSLEFKRTVVDEYRSNRYTVAQITGKHGISEAAVYKWVSADSKGVLSEPKPMPSTREGKLSKEQVSDIVKEYTEQRVGIKRLSDKYGVTPSAIIYILNRAGVYKGQEEGKIRQSKLTDGDIKAIIDKYCNTEMNVADIAERYGVTGAYVRILLQKHGVKNISKARKAITTSPKHKIKNEVIEEYKSGVLSHSDLAEKYRVSTRTISRILKDAGVEAVGAKPSVSVTKVMEIKDGVLADLKTGLDVCSVAEKYGVKVDTIKRFERQLSGGTSNSKNSDKNARIAELHSQGLLLKDIAKEADMSVYLVKKILEELGLEQNSPSDKHRPCVVELCKQGMSADSIASQVGLSVPTVRKILHEEGLTPSKGDSEVKKKVLELFKQGMKAPQIASECGISAPTVRKIIATSGQVKDFNERIVELYDGGMEIEQIAQEVGLNRPLVMIELSKAMKAGTLYKPFFPESDISTIKHLASKWTTPDKIASHIGCDENYIRRFLQLPDKKI